MTQVMFHAMFATRTCTLEVLLWFTLPRIQLSNKQVTSRRCASGLTSLNCGRGASLLPSELRQDKRYQQDDNGVRQEPAPCKATRGQKWFVRDNQQHDLSAMPLMDLVTEGTKASWLRKEASTITVVQLDQNMVVIAKVTSWDGKVMSFFCHRWSPALISSKSESSPITCTYDFNLGIKTRSYAPVISHIILV